MVVISGVSGAAEPRFSRIAASCAGSRQVSTKVLKVSPWIRGRNVTVRPCRVRRIAARSSALLAPRWAPAPCAHSDTPARQPALRTPHHRLRSRRSWHQLLRSLPVPSVAHACAQRADHWPSQPPFPVPLCLSASLLGGRHAPAEPQDCTRQPAALATAHTARSSYRPLSILADHGCTLVSPTQLQGASTNAGRRARFVEKRGGTCPCSRYAGLVRP
jgi:hypothetical protein